MMGLFEHWPYVNFHDLNLDWIIKEFPKVYASRDEAQASADASAESAAASQLSADASLASQEAAHQSELNAAQSKENAAESAQDAADTVENTLNQINLLQSRVDNIIPEGTQTEGNTELLDIRVSYDGTIYDSAGNAVRAQTSYLNDNITVLNEYLNVPKSLINMVGTYTSEALATTRRWFLNHIFPEKSIIKDVEFSVSQDWANTKIQYIEIWELNNGILTKVKTKTIDVQPSASVSGTVKNYTAHMNYVVQNNAMVCFLSTLHAAIPYTVDPDGNDTMLVSTDVDPDSQSINRSDISTFNIKLIPSITIKYLQKNNNVKTIGIGGDYDQIQDALLDITDDSETNPYTLFLLPSGTPYEPFTMIRNSFSDTYPWSGITPRNISIIGMDKSKCVIQSNSGDYKYPCGEPLTNGIIKNITFVMTNTEQTQTATRGGYCLHIDCKPLNDVGYNMTIEDCEFFNQSGPCLGIGIHQDCNLTVQRCTFLTTLNAEYNPHEGYTNLKDYGCVFCHTSTSAGATGQRFNLIDCIGRCKEGDNALRVNATTQYDPPAASFIYQMIRNVFWNEEIEAPGYQISSSLTPDQMNFGNNNE